MQTLVCFSLNHGNLCKNIYLYRDTYNCFINQITDRNLDPDKSYLLTASLS